MIVKNEANVITDLFDSIINIIDSYCICDIGSTDDTINIIKKYFENKKNEGVLIEGILIEEPFKNFSYNRNFALNACANMSDFILLMDADMILNIPNEFNKSSILSLPYEEFKILQYDNNNYLPNTRIIKNNGTFQYIGITHEYIISEHNSGHNSEHNSEHNNVHNNVHNSEYNGEYNNSKLTHIGKDILFITNNKNSVSKKDKAKINIILLKDAIKEDSNNSRYYFYLGNSYFDTNENNLAIETYKTLLKMNGCSQEKYVACIKIYEAYRNITPNTNEGISYLIQSYQYDNNRVEGIYRLIKHYHDNKQYEVAMTYYQLIRDYYENRYLTNDKYVKEDIHILFKLYIIQQEYRFYLPYYMINCINGQIIENGQIVENSLIETGIKMYEIIFELQFIPINDELIVNNLFINLQNYIDKIPEERRKNFISKYKSYIYLINKKYDIQDLYFTNSEDLYFESSNLEDNLSSEDINIILEESGVKIILNLMIKNESIIIERCINAVSEYVDGFCILDTGSTDNTIDVCNQVLTNTKKPFVINTELFKNFGHTRTKSFECAVKFCDELGWNKEKTYAMLIDADMVIKPSDQFKDFKNTMTTNGYQAIQKNGHITYYNTRFLKLSYDWKCIGATHEYWSGDPVDKIDSDIFYIDDINDGGCKSDKAERDIRLLNEDINENKNVDRAHFYLAQTLKGVGQLSPAIEKYEKRIQLGGWYEEIWYSYYQIGKCYLELKDYNNMELWLNKAFEFNNNRSEPLYILTKYFREISQHYKAYHYYLKGVNISYPKNEILFIEHDVYNGLFNYENTILAYYINKTRKESLCDIINYINKFSHNLDNVWNNLHFYIEALMDNTYYGKYTKFHFGQHNEYRASSCSILPCSEDANKYILNIRYVNYTITETGHYIMHSEDGHVKTKNAVMLLNSNLMPLNDMQFIYEDIVTYSSYIEGLEDVRIFKFKDEMYFTASSKNITNDDNINMTIGKYKISFDVLSNVIHNEPKISDVNVINPPEPTYCEKNWIYIPNYKKNDDMNFIYGWHPLKIGNVKKQLSENDNQLCGDKQLHIHTTYNTPNIFNRFRGSTHLVKHGDKYWGVIHFVKYDTPRSYYHCLVVFNEDIQPIQYSLPFCFRQTKIEYCIGFHIVAENNTDIGYFIFSENDSNPGFIEIPLNRFDMINI